jgi:hypothetical protein
MAYSSQLSLRGWIITATLAGALTSVFWFLQRHTLISGPEQYQTRRTTNLIAAYEKAALNIATASDRSEPIEPSFPNEASN